MVDFPTMFDIRLFNIAHSLSQASPFLGFSLIDSHSSSRNHIPLKGLVVELLFRSNLLVPLLVWQEKKIHGLEIKVSCFGVEAIDNHCCNEVEHREDDVGLVANIFKSGWCDFHDL